MKENNAAPVKKLRPLQLAAIIFLTISWGVRGNSAETMWLSCECSVTLPYTETATIRSKSEKGRWCEPRKITVNAGNGDLRWTRRITQVTDSENPQQKPLSLCKQMNALAGDLTVKALGQQLQKKKSYENDTCELNEGTVGFELTINPPKCESGHYMYYKADVLGKSVFVSEGFIPLQTSSVLQPEPPQFPSRRATP